MPLSKSTVAVFLLVIICAVTARKGFGPGSQEYGYVEVRKGAHMFYWLYYTTKLSEAQAHNAPLVIWLQGGPGGSSTGFGNFYEIGTLDLNLNERESAWTKYVNVLYIDNPVGTGFSYVDSEDLFTTTNQQIADDLVTFTKAFYKKFKKFRKTPLYIFTESYGGKMTIQFANELYKDIHQNKLHINFKGVALGDSWISPVDSCLSWAPYLLNLGIIDSQGNKTIWESAKKVQSAVESGDWLEATEAWSDLEGVVESVSFNVDFYNVLYGSAPDLQLRKGDKDEFKGRALLNRMSTKSLDDLMNGPVKQALSSVISSSTVFDAQSDQVFSYLEGDFMKPVTDVVEEVLTKTKLSVAIYSGQLDLIVDTPGTMNWVIKLNWPGASGWLNADREEVLLNNTVALTVKKYKQFSFYWISIAGHMVPTDNPAAGLELLRRVTKFK